MPHFNSVLRYFDDPKLTDLLHQLIETSSLPVRGIESSFAIDSSGFSTCRYDRWFTEKYGSERDENGEPIVKLEERSLKNWLKMHIVCGAKTNIITSVKITEKNSNDSPHFPELVQATFDNGFLVDDICADKGYSSGTNHLAAVKIGAAPYIMFKQNATGGVGGIFEAAFHYYQMNRAVFKEHYHQRSNVETTFHMVKSKFSGFVRSRNLTAQINELLCKVLCHNICVLIQSMFEFEADVDLRKYERTLQAKPALYLVK